MFIHKIIKNILIFSTVAALVLTVNFGLEKKYCEECLSKNTGVLYIKDLTNFKWDYAKLFIGTEDFKKIQFYLHDEVIFEESVRIDSDGELLSQELFTSSEKDISYYKCFYDHGALELIRIEEIEHSSGVNRYLYIYEPIECQQE